MVVVTEPYYEDDLVTLYHGDCREVTAWLEADVLVTDPPYGIGYRQQRMLDGTTQAERNQNSARLRAEGVERLLADKDTSVRDAALSEWGPDRPGLVFGSWRKPRPANVVQRLLWIKDGQPNSTGYSRMSWITGDEEIYAIGPSLALFVGSPRRGYYITYENRSHAVREAGHPTPKPLGLMEDLVARCPSGTVADPFAGSGSTLIAAKQLDRRAIGVELDERYCEIAAKRLGQDTLFGGAAS